ncbi:hypothetical protein [Bradyrhizobium sp.]|uniref:hypothetical protein n=2 Tax=Bradyrhizobium sp. TaxID=376 RepID=UPI003BD58708
MPFIGLDKVFLANGQFHFHRAGMEFHVGWPAVAEASIPKSTILLGTGQPDWIATHQLIKQAELVAELDAGILDHFCPLGRFFLDELGKLDWRVPFIHSSTSALFARPLMYRISAPGQCASICQSRSAIRFGIKMTRGDLLTLPSVWPRTESIPS